MIPPHLARALAIIEANPRDLLPAGHVIINRAIAELLRLKLVRYAPSRPIAYAINRKKVRT